MTKRPHMLVGSPANVIEAKAAFQLPAELEAIVTKDGLGDGAGIHNFLLADNKFFYAMGGGA